MCLHAERVFTLRVEQLLNVQLVFGEVEGMFESLDWRKSHDLIPVESMRPGKERRRRWDEIRIREERRRERIKNGRQEMMK